jgi:hypothetical protein
MPFESALQTAFLPSQQFWEAFSPSAPQMLPGGLHAVPLSQRLSSAVQTTLAPDPLQHASVESQKSPVIRQPPAVWQTVTPLPGSTQSREQQLEGPVQGLPPWTQPPEGSMQRPGEPAVVSQRPEQQSSPVAQTSPYALQLKAGAQTPALQFVEQHSGPDPHASPSVRQVCPVSPLGTPSHVPDDVALHEPWPEQHCDGLPQPSPIWAHASARQKPLTQFSVQQSASPAQVSPAEPQNSLVVQVFGPPKGPSQMPEQQSVVPGVQAVPSGSHVVEPEEQCPVSSQDVPSQQGVPVAEQAASGARQAFSATQVSARHAPEQQSDPLAQAAPFASHDGAVAQTPVGSQNAEQQSPATPQDAPFDAQSPPSSSLLPPLQAASDRANRIERVANQDRRMRGTPVTAVYRGRGTAREYSLARFGSRIQPAVKCARVAGSRPT